MHQHQPIGVFLYVLDTTDHVGAVFDLAVQARDGRNLTAIDQAYQLAHKCASAQVEDQSEVASGVLVALPVKQAVAVHNGSTVVARLLEHLRQALKAG